MSKRGACFRVALTLKLAMVGPQRGSCAHITLRSFGQVAYLTLPSFPIFNTGTSKLETLLAWEENEADFTINCYFL